MAWEQHSHADGETFTADDMNRMEEAIYDGGGYSSKKNWEDGNVPGAVGWNRLESGILSIGSDLVNPNLLKGSTKMDFTLYPNAGAGNIVVSADSTAPNGYNVSFDTSGRSACGCILYATRDGIIEGWDSIAVGEQVAVSAYVKSNDRIPWSASSLRNNSHTGISSSGNIYTTDEWQRLWTIFEKTNDTLVICFYCADTTETKAYFSGVKVEKASALSNWSPELGEIFTDKIWEATQDDENKITGSEANRWEQGITDMLDYREKYGEAEPIAEPQSKDVMEDSDEIPAVEAGEIE